MLAIFLSYLLLYKYTVLFAVIFLASLLLPLPAAALLMAAGAFSVQGYFDMRTVLAVGLSASVAGDGAGYLLSLFYGEDILSRIGFKKILKSSKFSELRSDFIKNSALTIFLSRFLFTHLGSSVNILSGISKIPKKKFFFYDFGGEIIYALLYGGLGYFFGGRWQSLTGILSDFTVILALAVLLVVIYKYSKNKKT